jgi:hypothetical protein
MRSRSAIAFNARHALDFVPGPAVRSWRLGDLARDYKQAAITENAIAKEIVDAAFGIHTTLGPGLMESVYHAVLAYELAQRRLRAVSQQAIPVVYGTIRIDIGFRADSPKATSDLSAACRFEVEDLASLYRKESLPVSLWS